MIHAGRKKYVDSPTHPLAHTVLSYVPELEPGEHTDT